MGLRVYGFDLGVGMKDLVLCVLCKQPFYTEIRTYEYCDNCSSVCQCGASATKRDSITGFGVCDVHTPFPCKKENEEGDNDRKTRPDNS